MNKTGLNQKVEQFKKNYNICETHSQATLLDTTKMLVIVTQLATCLIATQCSEHFYMPKDVSLKLLNKASEWGRK